jgi:trans-aconitate methyltransferase
MENLRQATIDTYDLSADALAEYFRGIGPRVKDIDLAFELAGNPKEARVLEIGCGDGRDAKDIINKASWYRGFDISSALINLAKTHVPNGNFEIADAAMYEYPENLDIVFAFASLLHLDKDEVQKVLNSVHTALNPGGIFYFYNPDIISALAGDGYEVVSTTHQQLSNTKWFEIALQKI